MATKKKTEKKEDIKEVKKVSKPVKTKKVETNNNPDNTDTSIEDRLKLLYLLQKVMSNIDEIKILRGDLPLEVQDLEDEILGLKTRSERYSSDIKEREKRISDSKNGIEEAKLKLSKKNEQQKDVVNNREYEILSKEIENLGLDIQIYEKTIFDSTEEIENQKIEYSSLANLIDEKNEGLKIKKEELEKIIVETKNEEEELRIEAKELENKIELRLLSAFKRIRKNARNGLAVVPVQRNSCSGCFSKIPPQRQMEIRQRRKIIVCENCGRILVDNDMTEEN